MKNLKIAIVFFLLPVFVYSQNADDILKKTEKKYNTIKDAVIEFTQISVFGVSKIENRLDGKLWMKKNNKYRIELENQTIVTDGKTVWSFYPLNKQVIIDDYKDDPNSISPDKVMINVPKNFNSVFIGNEKLGNKNVFVLKLTPKEEKNLIKSMKVWISKDDYLIEKVEVIDVNENISTYLSKNISLNNGIKDDHFRFVIPENVEVLDLRKNTR